MPARLHVILSRIRAFFRPDQLDREFDQEIEAHLAIAEANKIRQGMTPAAARRAARVELAGRIWTPRVKRHYSCPFAFGVFGFEAVSRQSQPPAGGVKGWAAPCAVAKRPLTSPRTVRS